MADAGSRILACGALKLYTPVLAEIRSLCVEPGCESRSLGRRLTEHLLDEAERLRLKTVFALTAAPGVFRKGGVHEVPRQSLRMKAWRDCLGCDRYACCRERAFVLELGPRRPPASSSSEPAAPPA